MIKNGTITTLTFDRGVGYKQALIKGLQVFQDNKNTVFIQPLNADEKGMRHFVPIPKEHIEELVEILNTIKHL